MIKQLKYFKGATDLLLALGMICILLVLFTPISSSILDFLLIINFSFALMILLITFFTEKPLEFSTFPSLLLMTTLFRLALNIAATRLILDDADAGKVIGSVGEHVVGGNYVIGLVVFLILIVVQYVVVTNGAQRVAEVAARFILDSMPGKQMSIDADLNMGIIDQDEAKHRRGQLEKEANFYGAMDGSSKSVKGDAIAGIIIILIDIIGGLAIGVIQKGMSWGDALQKYTLLTVGDGIVTQIPSLIIAVATGIIITRAATDTRLASAITGQFSAHPKVLIIVALTLAALMMLPGIPTLPIFIIISLLSFTAWFIYYKKSKREFPQKENQNNNELATEDENFQDLLKISVFELVIAKSLADEYFSTASDMENRIGVLRKQLVKLFGVLVPSLSTRIDNHLKSDSYEIYIQGIKIGQGVIRPERLLAINPGNVKVTLEGEDTVEPTYGLAAQWIVKEIRNMAQSSGYTLVEPETVLVTHIQEVTRKHISHFLSRSEVERMVEANREELGSAIDELIPGILTYSDIQTVFKNLLEEQVSIKNIPAIIEVLVDVGRQIKDPEQLTERIRTRLSAYICADLADNNGKLNMMTLAPSLERKFISSVNNQEGKGSLLPHEMEAFISKVAKEYERMLSKNIQPILLCSAPIRRTIRSVISRAVPQLNVISINEISSHVEVSSSAIIDIENKKLVGNV